MSGILDDIRLRPLVGSDHAYCVVSWCAALAEGNRIKGLSHDDAFDLYRPHVRRLLTDDRLERMVVCPLSDEEPIVAFIICRAPDLLLHLHVKSAFRGQRVATTVLERMGLGRELMVASDTRDARRLRDEHGGNWKLRIVPRFLVEEW